LKNTSSITVQNCHKLIGLNKLRVRNNVIKGTRQTNLVTLGEEVHFLLSKEGGATVY